MRRSVRAFRTSSNWLACLICLLDVSLFAGGLATVLLASSTVVKVIAAVVTGLAIARLFVVGHDACHQAFFSNRNANRWIGKLVFLPSLTPWRISRNLPRFAGKSDMRHRGWRSSASPGKPPGERH